MIAEIIAKNIEKMRVERNLTQEQVGSMLGMSRATYNGLENGKRPVAVDELEKLADYYGVTVESFFGRPINARKFEQMYLYILSHFKDGIPKTKLAKLLYLTDFSNFYDNLESMSGANYIRRQYGPVADIFFETTDNLYDDGMVDIVPEEFTLRIKPIFNDKTWDLISPKDMERMDKICKLWKDKRTSEIVNYTHHQKPWMACRDGEIIPYVLIVQEDPDNVYAPNR